MISTGMLWRNVWG